MRMYADGLTYFFFQNKTELQQEQPQFYASLAGHLSAEEQTMIQTIMVKADEVASQQVQQEQNIPQQQGQVAAGNAGAQAS